MIALAAACVAIAACGVMLALRGEDAARFHLAAALSCFAAVAALPLVVAFARGAYVYYLPLVLPIFLTLSPAVYLYVAARTSDDGALLPGSRHGMLPLAGLVVACGYWALPAAPRAIMFVEGRLPPGLAATSLAIATFALISFWLVGSFAYLIAVIRRLGAFRVRLKNLYSNTRKRELRWIDWFVGFLVLLWGVSALTLLSDNFGSGPVFSGEFALAVTAGLLLFLIAFSLAPKQYPDAGAASPQEPEDDPQKEKYARSALSPELGRELAQRIVTALRDDELYLDPDLSLSKLANHLRAKPDHISQTLNEHVGTTFFDYVAHWRIEAAKGLLPTQDASVLAIAFEVGFNSRSTFYKAFRRDTGMTPNEFRIQQRSRAS